MSVASRPVVEVSAPLSIGVRSDPTRQFTVIGDETDAFSGSIVIGLTVSRPLPLLTIVDGGMISVIRPEISRIGRLAR